MKNLDFKKFKKISEDREYATLEHSDGHQLKIAKKPLSYRMKAHLAAIPMAEGGEVKESKAKEPLEYEKVKEPVEYEAIKPKNPVEYTKMADGGKVMMAEGEIVDPSNLPHVTPSGEIYNPNAQSNSDQPFSFSNMSPALNPVAGLTDPISSNQVPGAPMPAAGMDITPPMSDVQPTSQAGAELAGMQQQPAAAPMASSAELAPSTQDSGVLGGAPSLQGGYEQQQKGIQQEAAGIAQQGKEEAKALQNQQVHTENAIKSFKEGSDKINNEFNAISQDIKNGHISDDHYWANHSKLATGLGLIIAGFNPTRNPNAAVEFLKHNLERDTQQQIAELGQKNNLLGHLAQQFGNVKDAAAFTNMLKAQQLSNQLQLAAAKSKDPLAAARMNEQAGQLTRQFYINDYLPMQMRQAMINAAKQPGGGGYEHMLPMMRMMAPEQAKEVESRLLPGLGPNGSALQTTVPVPEAARQSITSQNSLIQATSRLRDWITKNGSDVSKLDPAKRAQAQTLATELQGLYRQSIGASTSENEKNTIQSIISDQPLNLFSKWGSSPKLSALESSMRDRLDDQLKSLGANRGADRPSEIKIVNGVKWRRGPDGKAVRVK